MLPASPDLSYAGERVLRAAFPRLTITTPVPGIRFDRDVAVSMRDAPRLRVNVFRPERAGCFRSSCARIPTAKTYCRAGRRSAICRSPR